MSRIDDPENSPDGDGQEGAEQVRWLHSLGDRAALYEFMDAERDTTLGLQAAQALVELADVRGLDHLIASLKSADSSLRDEAAEILVELNHPRGLRALRELSLGTVAGPASRLRLNLQAPRDQLRRDLESHSTDELVALWHERQHSGLPDSVVALLEKILTGRLGSLPREQAEAGDEIDENVDPRIQALWMEGDSDALMRIFEDAADVRLQLEAAEALADLGDDDAQDVLIEALDDSNAYVREMAAEMLDWLDSPRGNKALRDRGIEFETDAQDLLVAPEPEPVAPAPSAPPQPLDPWGAKTRAFETGGPQKSPASAPLSGQMGVQGPAYSASSSGILLVGAVGGLIGFILFRLGLEFLGFQPLPTGMGGWFQPPALYYIGACIPTGAVSGAVGSRVAQAVGRRFGWEPSEGDLLPVFGALLEGASSALVVSLLIYAIIGF